MTDETAALREALLPFAKAADAADKAEYWDGRGMWADLTFGDLRRARAALAIPPEPDLRAQIEEVIAQIDGGKWFLYFTDVADALRAILPATPPPLVIEPGRGYRTRHGRKAIVLEAYGSGWSVAVRGTLGGTWSIYLLDELGRRADLSCVDIIAPWEDADNG